MSMAKKEDVIVEMSIVISKLCSDLKALRETHDRTLQIVEEKRVEIQKLQGVAEEEATPETTFRLSKNEIDFPKTYQRLLTMPGITEEERMHCIGDFIYADPDVAFAEDVEKFGYMSNKFKWEKMPSGPEFWRNINRKVVNAEHEEQSQKAASKE